jgi:hypothetical protein
VAGKKAEEVAGKSEVNQVPAKVEEKVDEGRAAESTGDRVRDDASTEGDQMTANGQGISF